MLTPNMGFIEVKDGDSPFYVQESSVPPNQEQSVNPTDYHDANTVQGLATKAQLLNAVISKASTGSGGAIAAVILPGSATSGTSKFLSYMEGTLAFLKANPPTGICVGHATDIGPAGAFYLFIGNATFGDGGWLLLSGS